MPAEWEPHLRTWMMWPCRAVVWPDMDETRRNYAAVAHAIRDCEPLTMLVRPEDRARAHDLLGSDIELLEAPIDDSWARDAGPCFVRDKEGNRAGVSFRFNAWGGKYRPYDGDDRAAELILEAAGVPLFASDLVAEGGGVSVDGAGTILTTESCFPNANRNPNWTRDEIEQELCAMLGGTSVIWLPGNVEETETDGHVDGIAVFLAPGLAVIEDEGSAHHPWRAINQANIAALEGRSDASGTPLRVIRMPEAEEADAGGYEDNFCRSYVNSYLCNGAVIMPSYGIKTDGAVREIYQDLCPDRRVIEVPIAHIALGGGGIHCITQQEPA
jgi:agmatine deiminase